MSNDTRRLCFPRNKKIWGDGCADNKRFDADRWVPFAFVYGKWLNVDTRRCTNAHSPFYWFFCSSPFVRPRRFKFCQKKEGKNVIEFPSLKSHEDLMPFPGNKQPRKLKIDTRLLIPRGTFLFFISYFFISFNKTMHTLHNESDGCWTWFTPECSHSDRFYWKRIQLKNYVCATDTHLIGIPCFVFRIRIYWTRVECTQSNTRKHQEQMSAIFLSQEVRHTHLDRTIFLMSH